MRNNIIHGFMFSIFLCGALPVEVQSMEQPSLGKGAIHQISDPFPYSLVSSTAIPLFKASEQESFLYKLEREVPPWNSLHDPPEEEMGGRLFDFNRLRDKTREGHPLLSQPIAYLWSGILRQYDPESKGYGVAIGPNFTNTEWGIIRFKPVGLPQEMIAIPSGQLKGWVEQQFELGKKVDIKILFSGRLIQDESLIYAFPTKIQLKE